MQMLMNRRISRKVSICECVCVTGEVMVSAQLGHALHASIRGLSEQAEPRIPDLIYFHHCEALSVEFRNKRRRLFVSTAEEHSSSAVVEAVILPHGDPQRASG